MDMTEKTVDLRGLVCPEPVLRTKKLLDDASVLRVVALVESEVNVNNLQRLARSLKLQFKAEPDKDFYRVTLNRENAPEGTKIASVSPEHAHEPAAASSPGSDSVVQESVGTVIFLSKDRFGDGDPEFSNSLLNMFLQTMLQSGHRPRAILMANTGVKLVAPDSPTLKVLEDFRQAGVEVLACGLCVDFYGLKGQIPIEQITNMFAICEFLMVADKVVQP